MTEGRDVINSAFAPMQMDQKRIAELREYVDHIHRERADDATLALAELIQKRRQASQDVEKFTIEEQQLRETLAHRAADMEHRRRADEDCHRQLSESVQKTV